MVFMRFGWPSLLLAVLAGVVGVCAALPDKDEPSPPARISDFLRPLSKRPLREARWRLSRLTEDVPQGGRGYYYGARRGGSDDKSNNKLNNGGAGGLLFRRQADTDLLMDQLLHIRRYHAHA